MSKCDVFPTRLPWLQTNALTQKDAHHRWWCVLCSRNTWNRGHENGKLLICSLLCAAAVADTIIRYAVDRKSVAFRHLAQSPYTPTSWVSGWTISFVFGVCALDLIHYTCSKQRWIIRAAHRSPLWTTRSIETPISSHDFTSHMLNKIVYTYWMQ